MKSQSYSLEKQQPKKTIGFKAEKKSSFLLKIAAIAGLVILSFVLGAIGHSKYNQTHGLGKNFGTIIIESIRLFQFSGGPDKSPIPLELEVSRWLSPVIAMYVAYKALLLVFREHWEVFLAQFYKGHVVVCGLGQKGVVLAQHYKSKGYKVIAIDRDKDNPNIKTCRDNGIIPLIGKADEISALIKARINQAELVCISCGTDSMNARVSQAVSANLSPKRTNRLRIKVHIDDPEYWQYIRSQLFSTQVQSKYLLDFFNIHDLAARKLISDLSLNVMSNWDPKQTRLQIIGFGKLAQQLALNLGRECSGFGDTRTKLFSLTIIDPEANRKVGGLISKFPRLSDGIDFNLMDIDPEEPTFYRDCLSVCKDTTPVLLNFDDEDKNLSIGLSLHGMLEGTNRLFIVPVMSGNNLSALLCENHLANSLTFFRVYNMLQEVCSADMIDKGSYEEIARAIHQEYLRREFEKPIDKNNLSRAIVPWQNLPNDLKEMNREQAIAIFHKLQLIGCAIVPWYYPSKELFKFTDEEIEYLAKVEHQRWCDLKKKQGWEYGPVRDEKRKKHPSIVAWESPEFLETEKEKDRNPIRMIPEYIRMAGFQILRSR